MIFEKIFGDITDSLKKIADRLNIEERVGLISLRIFKYILFAYLSFHLYDFFTNCMLQDPCVEVGY